MINNIDQKKLNNELKDSDLDYNLVTTVPRLLKDTSIIKWTICVDSKTGELFKVYNKHACFRYNGRPSVYDSEIEPETTPFDAERVLLPLLREEKYSFLPKIKFETHTFLGVEWFDDGWETVKWQDLITYGAGVVLPKRLFKNIARCITDLQLDTQEDLTEKDEAWYDEWCEYCTNEDFFNCLFDNDIPGEHCSFEQAKQLISDGKIKPGLMLSDIASDDFIINKSTGEWKMIDIDNFVYLWTPNTNYAINPVRMQSHLDIIPPEKYFTSNEVNFYFNGKWKTLRL